jgi:hypothetical protein
VYYFYKSSLLILYSSKCCNWKYILAQKHVFSLYAIILTGSVVKLKSAGMPLSKQYTIWFYNQTETFST